MASGSSSSITASPAVNYNVFLSFRGEDTRYSFTDHLYHALVRAGIRTFRDNDEIQRGEVVNLEIVRAIESSETSIVVLSENYATSTWCLDELCLILEQKRVCNHFVLPVFYHVDPSDVRKHKKNFMIEVNPSPRWTVDNVNKWKAALTEVADLAGHVLSGPETIFLKGIVDTIYNKLDRKRVCLPPNITGMDARVKEISSWLKQPDSEFLAICGMGGSGKTTLALHIVDSNWQNFQNISIIEDIGSKCKEPHDLFQLQEKLLGDILGGKKKKLPSVCQGTFEIEKALQTKKALIVLDDIVEKDQLVALLGTGKINKESKIIITTRESNTLRWFDSRPWTCQEYKMKLLDREESLELLSLHAFGSKIVMEGYDELAEKVLQYCEGNPLALKLLGSSLQEDNSIQSWKSVSTLLEKDLHAGIYRVLIRSYDSLPFDNDRELFLHIACFFIGKDMDYVLKILEQDYSAGSRIKTLTKRCLLSISSNKKLLMHPLLQEMAKTIVHKESPKNPAKRSRVWCNKESYDVLRKGKGSETLEGLALDMQMLKEGNYALKALDFQTDSLKKMDNLKLIQLKYVQFNGSYENFSEHLRWICWVGFHLTYIPDGLFMGNLVALDMSYSFLIVFEPPTVLPSLHILNLKDSKNLNKIRNISRLPNLETLILWNCRSLVHVCKTIDDLKSLALLNMTGCENLFKSSYLLEALTFSFPHTLQKLFLKDCYLEANSFSLSFSVQSFLQYLNLGNSLFKSLNFFNHLENLRILDLSFCSFLKCLLCLPSTLAELYIYYCISLEIVTFQSRQFTLQEFGYEGCISLCEIQGFIKLVPLTKLDEADLGHMKWVKEYQNHEMCLIGDDELIIGRSSHLQMLFEFNIMSTSLPDIMDTNMMPEYISEFPSLCFDVPLCPKDRRLKGLNITFKYTTLDVVDWAWFAKISTTNGVELIYNPIVFGKPAFGEFAIWLSYWPIGNRLNVGDKVNVSIIVMNGLEIHECGASLVYTDDKAVNDMELGEILGTDLTRFTLITGAYYLCRQDFFELMEVGKVNPCWFGNLVGDTIDPTEVRGWRKTGRPQQSEQSFTELKTVRCMIDGPDSEQLYKITEMSKRPFVNKNGEFTLSTLEDRMKSISIGGTFEKAKNIQACEEEDSKGLMNMDLDALDEPSSRKRPKNDVFLNYSFEDGRSFVSHLKRGLKRNGFSISDHTMLPTCQDETSGLLKAIQDSEIYLLVFSINYAFSIHCLDELVLIMECLAKFKIERKVIPIFFNVDPSDVREQQGSFTEAFIDYETNVDPERIRKWRQALNGACQFVGQILQNGDEMDFIQKILQNIKQLNIELRAQDMRRIPHGDVQNQLQISYDSLPNRSKKLFLDIVFFFDGMGKDLVVKVLQDEDFTFSPDNEIQYLVNKSLVIIDKNNTLSMHPAIREMGKEVVRRENEDEPGKRTRLMDHRDVVHVLRDCSGTESVEGIQLESYHVEEDVTVQVDAFKKMSNLRFIQLLDSHLQWSSSSNNEEISSFSFKKLKYLEWTRFPFKCIDNTDMGNVVVIKLHDSKLETLWEEGFKSLKKLRILDVSYSRSLTKIGNFNGLGNLEQLCLSECDNLEELHISIGCLEKLVSLDLSYCTGLKRFPWEMIGKLRSLQILNLEECPRIGLERDEVIEPFLSSLKECCITLLNLSECKISKISREVGSLKSLKKLNLNGNSLPSLPSLCQLHELETIDLDGCPMLKSFPNLPPSIIEITASNCISLVNLPSNMSELQFLKKLALDGCPMLKSFPNLPPSIKEITASNCISLVNLPSNMSELQFLENLCLDGCFMLEPVGFMKVTGLRNLMYLSMRNCNVSQVTSEIGNLVSLRLLNLSENPFSRLPDSFNNLSHLRNLRMKDCSELELLPLLPSNLTLIEASGCCSLDVMPFDSIQMAYIFRSKWFNKLFEESFSSADEEFSEESFFSADEFSEESFFSADEFSEESFFSEDEELFEESFFSEEELSEELFFTKDKSLWIGLSGEEVPEWCSYQNRGDVLSFVAPIHLDKKICGVILCATSESNISNFGSTMLNKTKETSHRFSNIGFERCSMCVVFCQLNDTTLVVEPGDTVQLQFDGPFVLSCGLRWIYEGDVVDDSTLITNSKAAK